MTHPSKVKPTTWLLAAALALYTFILIKFIVFKSIPDIQIGHIRLRFSGTHTGPPNFLPFATIIPQLSGRGNRLISLINLLGNILPFIPLGFMAPLLRPFSWLTAIALGIATGFTFELTELIFRVGIFDVDDILLNALGVIIGYAVFAAFRNPRRVP